MCDRCSLILCQGRIPAMQRRLEITDLDGTPFRISNREDNSVLVDPWPFTSDEFDVGVEVYTLTKLRFDDDEHLKSAIADSSPSWREWRFRRVD